MINGTLNTQLNIFWSGVFFINVFCITVNPAKAYTQQQIHAKSIAIVDKDYVLSKARIMTSLQEYKKESTDKIAEQYSTKNKILLSKIKNE